MSRCGVREFAFDEKNPLRLLARRLFEVLSGRYRNGNVVETAHLLQDWQLYDRNGAMS